jgi:uncharacterized phage-associated protein
MPTATHVAEWIVRHSIEDVGAPVDPMSLEKLLYYAQSFYLALYRRLLFADEIRAWRLGPVVRTVYDQYAEFHSDPIILPEGTWPELGEPIEEHLRQIVSFFGGYTALKLSDATHSEAPWLDARKGLGRRDKSDVIIPVQKIKQYYCQLLADGEEALSAQEMLGVVPEPHWGTFYLAGICVRHMTTHPFYDMNLAKLMQEPIPPSPELSDEFFAPIRDKSILDLGNVSALSVEEIEQRVSNAIEAPQDSNTD